MTDTPSSRRATPSEGAARLRDAALATRRQGLIEALRQTAAAPGICLVAAGTPLAIEGTDQHYPFRPHDDHRWCAGTSVPGAVLWLEPAGDTPCRLFAPVADTEERLWHGAGLSLDALSAEAGGIPVESRDDLESALARLGPRPVALGGSLDLVERPGAYGLHPGVLEQLAIDAEASEALTRCIHSARVRKDDWELALMRQAAAASRVGHLAAMRAAAPGMSEARLAVELHAGFGRAGATPAYASIVAGGPNAAVLHASPGSRCFGAEDLVLIDAGAEIAGYDSDVTRTFPAAGRYTGRARDLYAAVLDVQEHAVEGARAGREYADLHLACLLHIAERLRDLGLLRGEPADLVASETAALFMPHGLGHPIGLATHDVGGHPVERERSTRPSLRYLRTDRPLEVGMVVTIEPGIYFIPAILDDPDVRMQHRVQVDWDALAPWYAVGGVRIEDDVLITAGGPDVLTRDIPKTIEAVEAACAS